MPTSKLVRAIAKISFFMDDYIVAQPAYVLSDSWR